MTGLPVVTVLVDGRIVAGATPAVLQHDVVMSPVEPYVVQFAQRVESDRQDGSFTFVRGRRTFRVAIGSPFARNGDATQSLFMAPYLRAGNAIIPLGAVARALGTSVVYDAATRTLQIDVPLEPLATMTPFVTWSPPPEPLATFTPTPTPAPEPRATVTGVPSPRRTPIQMDAKYHTSAGRPKSNRDVPIY